MKHRSKDVTAATNPRPLPPSYDINTRGAVREPPSRGVSKSGMPPITPPTQVSGFGEQGIHSREAPRPTTSNLPKTVSARQILRDSFRYGGGRSAGNRSLAANMTRKVYEP
jgi:hypothetical protein